MAALLRDAIHPNLVQTLEGTPALVHGGPFANIAHGCNSVIATKLALKLGEICVTEAGFGIRPRRREVLRHQVRLRRAPARRGRAGGDGAGAQVPRRACRCAPLDHEDLAALIKRGLDNLEKHVEDDPPLRGAGASSALNRFPSDTERGDTRRSSSAAPRSASARCRGRRLRRGRRGRRGAGGGPARRARPGALGRSAPLYDWATPVKAKIDTIATRMYGAERVDYTKRAEAQIAQAETLGYGGLPICMAKTQRSLSDDPTLLGRPRGLHGHGQRGADLGGRRASWCRSPATS